MTETMFTHVRSLHSCWAEAVAEVLRSQWLVLDVSYRMSNTLWKATLPLLTASRLGDAAAGEASLPMTPTVTTQLVERATERLAKGLAPPREIYDVQNRGRMDWLQVPEWARPGDPELFEGCVHEG
jgi:hypothetical protein